MVISLLIYQCDEYSRLNPFKASSKRCLEKSIRIEYFFLFFYLLEIMYNYIIDVTSAMQEILSV